MSNASANSSLFGTVHKKKKNKKYGRTEVHVSSQREDFDLRQLYSFTAPCSKKSDRTTS